MKNAKWIYSSRPAARVSYDNYTLEESDLDESLSANEVLIKITHFSVDPYMRIQQAATTTWEKPHPLGVVQGGGTVGEVIASTSEKFQVGDWVVGYLGWQKYARCHCNDVQKIDKSAATPSYHLGVLGMPGRTAWFGLMEAGKPKPGEVVVVSGAAGAVGSLVCQYAKLAGCKVYGIAGSDEKCKYLVETLKLDGAFNYKKYNTTNSLSEQITKVTSGVDIYFDNVGGWITDTIIPLINLRARIIICGQITQYDGGLDSPNNGPRFFHHILYKRATIQGILARDYTHRMNEMLSIVLPWVQSGKIVFEETTIHGFDKLPEALALLFEGGNIGKMIVTA